MKITQILNFIPLRSLKYSLTLILFSFVFGCNRQPEACVEINTTSTLVGSPVVATDCSEKGFDNLYDFGNGAKFSNETSVTYAYYQGGNYSVQLTSFSKKNNKKDTDSKSIRVTYPTQNQLLGKWTLTKVETREQLEIDPTLSIFDLPIDSSRTFQEKYEITTDSIFVQHNGEQFYLFQFRNGYSYENGALIINQSSFPIVQFSSNSMVLQGPYFKGFELLYLER